MTTKLDDYDLGTIAYDIGYKAFEVYVDKMYEHFGTFVPQPKSPHSKGTIEHQEWWTGYTDAQTIWFSDGKDPFAELKTA